MKMKIGEDRIDTCTSNLNQLLEAGDKEALEFYALKVYDGLVKAYPGTGRESIDEQSFSDLVDLMKVLDKLLPVGGILCVAGNAMMKRPGKPFEEQANEPVEANSSTPKIIELFMLLAGRAKAGSESYANQNVMHLLRQVLTQNARYMTMAQMKPFLEISAEITFASRNGTSSLGEFHGPRSDYFEHSKTFSGSYGSNVDTIPNQGWVALLNNCFESGPEGCEPQYVLTGECWAQDFDRLALLILQMKQHDIKMPLRRTDVVLVSQILERMVYVMAHEPSTPRAQHMGTALCALVDITLPIEKKITLKNNIFYAPVKKNPMADNGFYNLCTLGYLKAASKPIDHPAAERAIELFKYQVLLHSAHISPVLQKQRPKEFHYKAHLAELAQMCESSLLQDRSLSPLSDPARLALLSSMDETPLRAQLLLKNMKVRKELFVQELGV